MLIYFCTQMTSICRFELNPIDDQPGPLSWRDPSSLDCSTLWDLACKYTTCDLRHFRFVCFEKIYSRLVVINNSHKKGACKQKTCKVDRRRLSCQLSEYLLPSLLSGTGLRWETGLSLNMMIRIIMVMMLMVMMVMMIYILWWSVCLCVTKNDHFL